MTNVIDQLRAVLALSRKPVAHRRLAEKLLIAGSLTTIEHVVTVLFRIGSTLIMTRLLAPDIFGLFAIIMTFHTILALITDFGIRDLILTTRVPRDLRFLHTCWTIQVFRGFIIYGIILGLSGAIYLLQQGGVLTSYSVYGAHDLPLALAVSGVLMVLQGFESVNLHVYAREMRFRLFTVLKITTAILGPVLTILIALVEPSVWALVIGGLIAAALKLWLTHFLFEGPTMGICLDRRHRHELFNRGKWILGRSSMHIATTQADRLVLSACLPDTVFGLYFLAKQIFMVPELLLQKLHTAFGLQFFREIIELPAREMQARYYRYRIPMDVAACIFAGGFLTAAPAVIGLMYDPRYHGAGEMLQILGLGLPFFGMGMIREGYGAQQRFRITAAFGLIQAVTIWTGLIIALAIYDNQLAALFIIALHRLPELATLLMTAYREGWVNPIREIRLLPTVGIGALIGLGLDALISVALG